MLKKLLLSGLLLSMIASIASCNVARPTSAVARLQADNCRSSVPLTPKEAPGPIWVRHRHWLECSSPCIFGRDYTVIDVQTGEHYDWSFDDVNLPGHPHFDVSTRWALTHPGWKSHDWLLLYDCTQD